MCNILIIGAGGLGREVKEYLLELLAVEGSQDQFIGFLDDTYKKNNITSNGDIVHDTVREHVPSEENKYILAIGDPIARGEIFSHYKQKGAVFYTLVHPKAYRSASSVIEEGSILCPFSFVGAGSMLSANVLINIYASVGHDCNIGQSTVLSPYASTNGNAMLENQVFLGSGAVITSGVQILSNSKVAAGSVVYSNVPTGATALGNPARLKK